MISLLIKPDRVGGVADRESKMGCGTSRPREMQVIHHAPWSWYGGRVAPDLEPDGKPLSGYTIYRIILIGHLIYIFAHTCIHMQSRFIKTAIVLTGGLAISWIWMSPTSPILSQFHNETTLPSFLLTRKWLKMATFLLCMAVPSIMDMQPTTTAHRTPQIQT